MESMDWFDLAQDRDRRRAFTCKCGNKLSGSIKFGAFPDQLRNGQLLRRTLLSKVSKYTYIEVTIRTICFSNKSTQFCQKSCFCVFGSQTRYAVMCFHKLRKSAGFVNENVIFYCRIRPQFSLIILGNITVKQQTDTQDHWKGPATGQLYKDFLWFSSILVKIPNL